MREHVEPKRLFALAQLETILDQPEWKHLRHCNACFERFALFVRQLHQDKKLKNIQRQ